MRRRAVLRCALAAVLFGAAAPATSRLADHVPAVTLAGLLYLGAAVAVLPWVVSRPPARAAVRAEWRPALVASVLGGAVGPALFVMGLARTSAASASLLLNFEVVATVLVAAVAFREHLGRRLIVAVTMLLGAGAFLSWRPGIGLETGGLLVLGACACWGVDNAVTARMEQLAPEHLVLLKGVVAAVTNLGLAAIFVELGHTSIGDVVAALVIGAVGYGFSITLWITGARDLGGARAQVIFASAPFIGAAIAWVGLRESVTGLQLLAVALAAAGVVISLGDQHQHAHRHRPVRHAHEHDHDDGHHDHHAQPVGSHSHVHVHEAQEHVHPHVPDLHHAHDH